MLENRNLILRMLYTIWFNCNQTPPIHNPANTPESPSAETKSLQTLEMLAARLQIEVSTTETGRQDSATTAALHTPVDLDALLGLSIDLRDGLHLENTIFGAGVCLQDVSCSGTATASAPHSTFQAILTTLATTPMKFTTQSQLRLLFLHVSAIAVKSA